MYTPTGLRKKIKKFKSNFQNGSTIFTCKSLLDLEKNYKKKTNCIFLHVKNFLKISKYNFLHVYSYWT